MMTRVMERLRDQRGTVLVLVAAAILGLVSAVALAVDIGHLVTARNEAQRAADAAALAGAGWLIIDADDEGGARSRAIEYAGQNAVRGLTPVVDSLADIDVILDSAKVRVRVHMIADRNLAIPTFFARVFGLRQVDVSAKAAAWAAPADELPAVSSDCPLPIALPDRWVDANGNDVWDPGEGYDPQNTGLGDYDIGDLVVLKVSGSQDLGPKRCRNESTAVDLDLCRELPDSDNWRCWYRESEGASGGTDVLGPRIYPGENCGPALGIGDTVWTASASGNKQSLVHTTHADFGGSGPGSFADLIRADEDLIWNATLECPVRSGTQSECVQSSPRWRKVPIVRPDAVTGTGAGVNTTIIDFTGIFVEKVGCNYDLPMFDGPGGNWNVYVRLTRAPSTGKGGGNGTGPGPDPGGTTLKKLQLIE